MVCEGFESVEERSLQLIEMDRKGYIDFSTYGYIKSDNFHPFPSILYLCHR